MELVGIVRSPLASLVPYGEGRSPRPEAVKRLVRVFNATKCDSKNHKNHIQGIITPVDLQSILSILRISRHELARTVHSGDFPLLADYPIAYLSGRQRLAAADRKSVPRWTIRLLCVEGQWLDFPTKLLPSNPQLATQIQDQVDFASHEAAYSDADVYRLVHRHMSTKDAWREAECRARLSIPKEISLDAILKNKQIDRSLKALLRFPGVIGGLQLGNFHKHLALHCDENIVRYFDSRVRSLWEFITDNNPVIAAAVDLETVQHLQYRAPSLFESDRREITQLMDRNKTFRALSRPDLREGVKMRLLSVNTVISSLETFHENMKYFALGARALMKFLLVKEPLARNRLTLFASLAKDWQRPVVTKANRAELDEIYVQGMPEVITSPWLAYKIVFSVALRNFASLGTERPRQDVRGECMPAFERSVSVTSLLKLALAVGFKNSKIQEILERPPDSLGNPTFIPADGKPADWRAGIPFTKTYLTLQSRLSPKFDHEGTLTGSNGPSIIFQDFIQAFFGGPEISSLEGTGSTSTSPPAMPLSRSTITNFTEDGEQPSQSLEETPEQLFRRRGESREQPKNATEFAGRQLHAQSSHLSYSPQGEPENQRHISPESDTFDREQSTQGDSTASKDLQSRTRLPSALPDTVNEAAQVSFTDLQRRETDTFNRSLRRSSPISQNSVQSEESVGMLYPEQEAPNRRSLISRSAPSSTRQSPQYSVHTTFRDSVQEEDPLAIQGTGRRGVGVATSACSSLSFESRQSHRPPMGGNEYQVQGSNEISPSAHLSSAASSDSRVSGVTAKGSQSSGGVRIPPIRSMRTRDGTQIRQPWPRLLHKNAPPGPQGALSLTAPGATQTDGEPPSCKTKRYAMYRKDKQGPENL